ncbi:hypothetical protein [Microscilla marina]|uniref:Uncharacterized protein n=1 Tax=Microscilla marina ATCC 23134 TaxID=313606 RepID=A1ZHL7_MICM2|nr:hypothetical protein [Microscilla marina]EAY30024.1 hypothetical protein M23134_05357 [Microscilla marina ATCC 23134]
MQLETIYQSRYQSIAVEKSLQLGHQEWYQDTVDMSDDEYRKDLGQLVRKLERQKIPQKWLINLSGFHYIMSPEMQEWHSLNVFQKIFVGQEFYFAVLSNGDFVNDLAVSQTFDETGNLILTTKYFKEETPAYAWLLDFA